MKSDKQRTQDANARKKARGLVPLYKWIHKDDKPAAVAFIDNLNRKREDNEGIIDSTADDRNRSR